MSLLVASLVAPTYMVPRTSSCSSRHRAVRAQAFPDLNKGAGTPGLDSSPAPDPEEPDIRRGARIFGGLMGGTTGAVVWSIWDGAGLSACSPFDPEGCVPNQGSMLNRNAAPMGNLPKLPTVEADDLPFGLGAILSNPASILPGQDYIKSVNQGANERLFGPISSPAPSTDATQSPADAVASPIADGFTDAATDMGAATQSTTEALQSMVDSVALSLSPVLPASAANLPPSAMALFDETRTTSLTATSSLLDNAAFGAIADGGFGPGGGFWTPLLLGLVGAAAADFTCQQDDEIGAIVRQIAKVTDFVYVKVRVATKPITDKVSEVLPF